MSDKDSVLDMLQDFVDNTEAGDCAPGASINLHIAHVHELLGSIDGLVTTLDKVNNSSREVRNEFVATLRRQAATILQAELDRDVLIELNMRQAALIRELREEAALATTEIDELYAELEEAAEDEDEGKECTHCSCYDNGDSCCSCEKYPDPKAA